MNDIENSKILRMIFALHERVVTAITAVIVLVFTLIHDVFDVIFGGGHIHHDGEKLTTTNKKGKVIPVKDRGLLVELLGFFIGGTTQRDEHGRPILDDNGKRLKHPGFFAVLMLNRMSTNVTKTNGAANESNTDEC